MDDGWTATSEWPSFHAGLRFPSGPSSITATFGYNAAQSAALTCAVALSARSSSWANAERGKTG